MAPGRVYSILTSGLIESLIRARSGMSKKTSLGSRPDRVRAVNAGGRAIVNLRIT